MTTDSSWVDFKAQLPPTVRVVGSTNIRKIQRSLIKYRVTVIVSARIHTSFTQYAPMMLDKILQVMLKVKGLNQLENREEVLQREK